MNGVPAILQHLSHRMSLPNAGTLHLPELDLWVPFEKDNRSRTTWTISPCEMNKSIVVEKGPEKDHEEKLTTDQCKLTCHRVGTITNDSVDLAENNKPHNNRQYPTIEEVIQLPWMSLHVKPCFTMNGFGCSTITLNCTLEQISILHYLKLLCYLHGEHHIKDVILTRLRGLFKTKAWIGVLLENLPQGIHRETWDHLCHFIQGAYWWARLVVWRIFNLFLEARWRNIQTTLATVYTEDLQK